MSDFDKNAGSKVYSMISNRILNSEQNGSIIVKISSGFASENRDNSHELNHKD
jgi:hypothetical protein